MAKKKPTADVVIEMTDGDNQVDVTELLGSDPPKGGKSLGRLAADELAGELQAPTNSMMKLLGGSEKAMTIIDDAVASRRKTNADMATVLDQNQDDITRARAMESMAMVDAMRGDVIADAYISSCLESVKIPEALDTFSQKHRIRAGALDMLGKRKKMELEDLAARQRHITQRTVNQLSTVWAKALEKYNVEGELREQLLQFVADEVAILFGDEDDAGE